MPVLVTGGTGTVGRPTVEALRARGIEPRILSRRAGDGHMIADLRSGSGLDASLAGVRTVVHLATNRRNDVAATQRLLDAAQTAGVAHVVYLSIVGVDAVPLGYYRAKLRCEEAIAASGPPFTIVRATQFHDFVAGAFRAQRRLPRLFVADVPFQPVDTSVVAARLSELTQGTPVGERVPDIGGPEALPMRELARQWLIAGGTSPHSATGRVVTLRPPGRLVAAYRAGLHTTGAPGTGPSFAEWAQHQP